MSAVHFGSGVGGVADPDGVAVVGGVTAGSLFTGGSASGCRGGADVHPARPPTTAATTTATRAFIPCR